MLAAEDLEVAKERRDWFEEGMKLDEVVAVYDGWGDVYEEMMVRSDFRAPDVILEEVLRRIPSEKRPETRVLDVAAGTGLVGCKLHKEGFRHIDAVEPAEGMIKKLRECGVYTNDFVEDVGSGHTTVPQDTYDLVVVCGGMGEGHIPVSGVDDFIRFARPGGFVIIVMRHEFLSTVTAYKDKLEPYMDELEEKGAWRKVERRVFPNYMFGLDGVVFTFVVT